MFEEHAKRKRKRFLWMVKRREEKEWRRADA